MFVILNLINLVILKFAELFLKQTSQWINWLIIKMKDCLLNDSEWSKIEYIEMKSEKMAIKNDLSLHKRLW